MQRELVNIALSDCGADSLPVLTILDQTRLPGEVAFADLTEAAPMYEAIRRLQVRGAPAIGIFAAYALYVLGARCGISQRPALDAYLRRQAAYLNSSRPTAVNLSWALQRQLSLLAQYPELDAASVLPLLKAEAIRIHEEDKACCRAISEYGLSLLAPGMGVITHCNAGPLATSRLGTGQGPLYLAQERGYKLRVYADETRPLLQGARLTAWELQQAGVDVTLICDNMASLVMKRGLVDICLFGSDRIAMNGDVANKIGSSGLAVLAHYYGIPCYALAPTSTVDRACPDGDHIQIEERDPEEIRSLYYARPQAPEGVKCFNPAFDVTDHALLSGIITEKGIARPPFDVSLPALFA